MLTDVSLSETTLFDFCQDRHRLLLVLTRLPFLAYDELVMLCCPLGFHNTVQHSFSSSSLTFSLG